MEKLELTSLQTAVQGLMEAFAVNNFVYDSEKFAKAPTAGNYNALLEAMIVLQAWRQCRGASNVHTYQDWLQESSTASVSVLQDVICKRAHGKTLRQLFPN